jgi:hypothetical protein
MADIFISYAKTDRSLASKLVAMLTDLISGQVLDVMVAQAAVTLPQVRGGTIKAIANLAAPQGRRSFEGPLEEMNGGSARPVTKIRDQVHYRKWLIPLLLIVVTGAIWLSFLGESARTVSRNQAECVTGTWRTRITFDDSRPELVSTTLRSRNRISSRGKNGCVDIAFACRSDGPYFEVRVEPQGPQIGKKGLIVVEGLGDELNASVSGWRSNDGRSITISDKAVVEVLGSLLIDRGSFAVRLGLLEGGDAVAHFDSANLHSAIRPVMLACGRSGQQ